MTQDAAFASHVSRELNKPQTTRHSTVTYTVIVALCLHLTFIVQDSGRHTLLVQADLQHKHTGSLGSASWAVTHPAPTQESCRFFRNSQGSIRLHAGPRLKADMPPIHPSRLLQDEADRKAAALGAPMPLLQQYFLQVLLLPRELLHVSGSLTLWSSQTVPSFTSMGSLSVGGFM